MPTKFEALEVLAGSLDELAITLSFKARQLFQDGAARQPDFDSIKARLNAIKLSWSRIEAGNFEEAIDVLRRIP